MGGMTVYEHMADEAMRLTAIGRPGTLVTTDADGGFIPAPLGTATAVIVDAWLDTDPDSDRLKVFADTLPIPPGANADDVREIRYRARYAAADARLDARAAAAAES